MAEVLLTELVKAGGCGSKLGLEDLSTVLAGLKRYSNENFIFGFGLGDDAAVFKLSEELALVQTLDFFTPIVDDPYTFGAIAAANALSDCYALGAKPLTALNIVCFPMQLGPEVLREILRGGAEKVIEAGATLVGGHSIKDSEPKYGLCISGVLNPKEAITNQRAQPGDLLVLTKRIGVGMVTGNWKKQARREVPGGITLASYQAAVKSMLTLNKSASELLRSHQAHACTDITGFGLLNHAHNIAAASGVALEINYSKDFIFPQVEQTAANCAAGGCERNQKWSSSFIKTDPTLSETALQILNDPQTSGPLLIALPKAQATDYVQALKEKSGEKKGEEQVHIIGQVTPGPAGEVWVRG